jgi:hypothetical protein
MSDEIKKMNPHLFRTIQDLTTGVRKSSWFTSDDFNRLLQSSVVGYLYNFSDYPHLNLTRPILSKLSEELDSTFSPNNYHTTNASPTSSFYNFFFYFQNLNLLIHVELQPVF